VFPLREPLGEAGELFDGLRLAKRLGRCGRGGKDRRITEK
jgi:hypothetical protein